MPIWNAIPRETHAGGGYTQARNSICAVSRSFAVSLPFWFHWIFYADRFGCTVWSIIIRLIGHYLYIASIAMENGSNFTRDEHDACRRFKFSGWVHLADGMAKALNWITFAQRSHRGFSCTVHYKLNSEFVESPDYCSWMHPTYHSQSTVSIEFIGISDDVHRTITARIFRIPANCDLIFMQPRVEMPLKWSSSFARNRRATSCTSKLFPGRKTPRKVSELISWPFYRRLNCSRIRKRQTLHFSARVSSKNNFVLTCSSRRCAHQLQPEGLAVLPTSRHCLTNHSDNEDVADAKAYKGVFLIQSRDFPPLI